MTRIAFKDLFVKTHLQHTLFIIFLEILTLLVEEDNELVHDALPFMERCVLLNARSLTSSRFSSNSPLLR